MMRAIRWGVDNALLCLCRHFVQMDRVCKEGLP